MRKFLKKQILDMLATLEDASKEISKYIKSGDINTAVGIMAGCQKSAVAIGNTIEKSEGEGTRTVGYVEDYYELLFNLSETLQSGDSSGVFKIKKLLSKISYSVEEEIKTKTEIAFFPYKASMWDSLESIWLAAKEDDRCECFVVPIPYYDRRSDGSFGEMHYEGDDYPSYVPITDWRHYDLPIERPDIAYIHNPYDQFNYVTSVHPSYYSHEIKKHVETLVYVPYYSTSGGMSEGQAYLSAYFYADYTIMQSEWFRPFFDPSVPQERLLPLGSPKFDRVIRLSKNRPAPPMQWQDKMNGKTVYFFNTSVGGLLGNTEVFLRKMVYVFNCFCGRENALLLWRPHPLLESTLDSMRPQFKQAYMQLKNWFIGSGLGIYDDTSDIESSIALSDAYIGDAGTSVTSLFGMAGKPLFILNNDIDTEPEPEDLTTLALGKMYIEGTTAWIVSICRLRKFDLESGAIESVCQLTDMTLCNYWDVIKADKRFFVGPTSAQDICVVEDGKLRKIALKHLNSGPNSFVGMLRCGKYLLLIPNRYPALVRYNIDTEELTYFGDVLKEFAEAGDRAKFFQDACRFRDGLLYMATAFDNRIMIFDIEGGKYSIKTIGQISDRGCQSMVDDGVDFWILPLNGAVITRWNPDTDEVKEYSQYPQGFEFRRPDGDECQERPFISAVCFDDFVLMVPIFSNMFVKIDKKTGEISKWVPPFTTPKVPKNCYYKTGMPFGIALKTSKTGFMVFSYYNRVLYHVNIETGECVERQYRVDLDYFKDSVFGFNQVSEWLQYACMEDGLNSLPAFLNGKLFGKPFDAKRQVESYSKICANNDGTCGEKIHGRIMDEHSAKRR
jgi:hypothetical protein